MKSAPLLRFILAAVVAALPLLSQRVEVEEFVRPILEEQRKAEEQQAASEPDPNSRFAVDITGDAFDEDGIPHIHMLRRAG